MLRQRLGLCLLVFVLAALVLGFIFRQQQVAYTPIKQHYRDRWTGIEWVKTYTWGGLIRVPVGIERAAQLTAAEKLTKVARLRRQDSVLTVSWYVAVIVVSALIINNLTKNRK